MTADFIPGSALRAARQTPHSQAHPRMNRPGHNVREVPEPGLIAPEILVGLLRSLVSSLGIGIGRHRITDTMKLDQVGIRSTTSLHRREPCKAQHAEDQEYSEKKAQASGSCPHSTAQFHHPSPTEVVSLFFVSVYLSLPSRGQEESEWWVLEPRRRLR